MEGNTPPGFPEGILRAMAAVRDRTPVKVLRGYLDTEASPPRLYAGLDFSVYLELDGIVSYQPGPEAADPWLVWVKEDLPLEVRVTGRDPYGALLTENPDFLFGLASCDQTVMAYTCSKPKTTSHTIGWCAED